MSEYSFPSDDSDRNSVGESPATAKVQGDELLTFEQSNSHKGEQVQASKVDKSRSINLILDHSAFVRGIGNIKRWFNDDYVKTNLGKNSEAINLNIFIPSYTLHEFDFIKKGTSMTATNAREAIRFIDKFFESDPKFSDDNPIMYNLIIQAPNEDGPPWNECMKYKIHSPRIKEFPNFKTKFDSNFISVINNSNPEDYNSYNNLSDHFNSSLSFKNSHNANDIQYENSASYQNALAHSDERAEMPARLRYLIRTCIYKTFVENSHFKSPIEQWKLVTEDPITKIWAKSFGLDCLNVNEAELVMFQNYDVNQFRLYDPHNQYSMEDSYDPTRDILQNTIDTTSYVYTSMREDTNSTSKFSGRGRGARGRGRGRRGRGNRLHPIQGVVEVEGTGIHGEFVKKERFDAINYAPRGNGELWKP
ncbi:uncharacterized protein RJT20DRAFT_28815 [Scheffersomyces xylosifermentans]|uniref:uncharacterized protein n=1 Tax=Scheffersomyces xylosifermentans TaxID=1304137 RepID=UPI00315D2516